MKKIKIISACFILIFALSGCSKQENEILKEKITEEISYLEYKLINMLNQLNNISLENYSIIYNKVELKEDTEISSTVQTGNGQSENQGQNQNGSQQEMGKQDTSVTITELKPETILGTNNDNINWELLEEEIEVLNTSWSIILLDLYSANVQNTEILGFSDKLNNTIISIENRDKINTLIGLRDLYSYMPVFIEMSNIGEENKEIKQAKLHLINAYVSVDEDNWDNVNNELINCETEFNKLSNNVDYAQNREYKINKIYVLIKELQNSISSKDKKIFYMKYKNLLQSINSI